MFGRIYTDVISTPLFLDEVSVGDIDLTIKGDHVRLCHKKAKGIWIGITESLRIVEVIAVGSGPVKLLKLKPIYPGLTVNSLMLHCDDAVTERDADLFIKDITTIKKNPGRRDGILVRRRNLRRRACDKNRKALRAAFIKFY